MAVVDIMLSDIESNEILVVIKDETTGISSEKYGYTDDEIYRMPISASRSIIIDKTGKKTLVKDVNTK